jgi:hypothetical protein
MPRMGLCYLALLGYWVYGLMGKVYMPIIYYTKWMENEIDIFSITERRNLNE